MRQLVCERGSPSIGSRRCLGDGAVGFRRLVATACAARCPAISGIAQL
jgi:hypothetical protein